MSEALADRRRRHRRRASRSGSAWRRGCCGLVTRTINDLYFVLSVRDVALDPLALAKGVLLGLGATALAALGARARGDRRPAARRDEPRRARDRRAPRPAARATWLGLGSWRAARRPVLALPGGIAGGFAGLFVVMIGCALVAPAAALVLLRLLHPRRRPRPSGSLGRLATRGIVAALSRTSVAIAALMIAVSATIGVGVMIASFREAVVRWLEGTLRADIYVSAPSLVGNRPDATLDPALVGAPRRHARRGRARARRAASSCRAPGGAGAGGRARRRSRAPAALALPRGQRGRRLGRRRARRVARLRALRQPPRRARGRRGAAAHRPRRARLPRRRRLLRLRLERGRGRDEPPDLRPRTGTIAGSRASRWTPRPAPTSDALMAALRGARGGRPGRGRPLEPRAARGVARDLRPHLRHHRRAAHAHRRGRLRRHARRADGAAARARARDRRAADARPHAAPGVGARHRADRADGPARRPARGARAACCWRRCWSSSSTAARSAGRCRSTRRRRSCCRAWRLAVLAAVLAGLYPGVADGDARCPPTRCAMSRRAPRGGRRRGGGRARWSACWSPLAGGPPARGGAASRRRSRCARRSARATSTGFARALGAAAVRRFPTTTGRTRSSAPSGGTTRAISRPPTGRHFGFQLTFFRTALAPPDAAPPSRASAWASAPAVPRALRADRHGRPALPRVRAGSSRAALGLAGARATPFPGLARGLVRGGRGADGRRCGCAPPRATSPSTSSSRAASRSCSRATAASAARGPSRATRRYYYSFTRMPRARHRARWAREPLDGVRPGVDGPRVEHERARPGPRRLGLVRAPARRRARADGLPAAPARRDGRIAHSAGTLVAADGTTRPLARGRRARSRCSSTGRARASGVRYPARWRLSHSRGGPARSRSRRGWPTQELIVGTRYWEGAVRVDGAAAGAAGHRARLRRAGRLRRVKATVL